jgi:hypothetical protein
VNRESPGATPAKHPFLSPEWVDAVTAIHDEYLGKLPPPPVPMRANVVVTDVPFGSDDVHGCVDTSQGFVIGPGHLDQPDFTATLDYDTAKALFVDQDPQAIMQAFFGGKIRLTGDATKLLTLPLPKPGDTGAGVDLAREVSERIRAVTE